MPPKYSIRVIALVAVILGLLLQAGGAAQITNPVPWAYFPLVANAPPQFASPISPVAHLPIVARQPPPAPTPAPPADLIVIQSPYENRPEYSNYVTYFGEFWNNTDQPVRWVEAHFAFYNSEGQLTGSKTTTNSSLTFAPGERICWKLWVKKNWGAPVLFAKEFYVGQFSSIPHDVRIQNTRLITDETDFTVIGEIVNGGPYPIRNMRVSTTLYNPQQQVVGCDPFSYPEPDPLPVGGLAIFEADSFYDADQANATGYYIYSNFHLDINSLALQAGQLISTSKRK